MARPKKTMVDNPEQNAAAPTLGGRKEISKTGAVRKALAVLGRDVMPKEIQDFVFREYGIVISLNHVSNIKSGLGRKGGKKGGRRKKSAQTVTPVHADNGAATHAKPAQDRHAGAVSLNDIETAQQLAERVGVRELHALIDLVAR